MDGRTLTDRVEILEKQVASLELLPARIDGLALQIAQLGEEMRREFSAMQAEIRAEIRAGDEETRAVLSAEIRAADEETRAVLRAEIRAGDAESRTFMRVLHEDLVDRIKLLGERFR